MPGIVPPWQRECFRSRTFSDHRVSALICSFRAAPCHAQPSRTQPILALPRRAKPHGSLSPAPRPPSPVGFCPVRPGFLVLQRFYSLNLKTAVLAGLRRSPIPQTNPLSSNPQPVLQLTAVHKLLIAVNNESAGPTLKHCPRTENSVLLHHHRYGEGRGLAQILRCRPVPVPVVVEGAFYDDQPLAYKRALLQFPGC